ncbi:uncharacterized protein LOC143299236 [Babylonia areolata]|uniref:uncharacterized protein LOC143299236 n=1 Tax=Babylonia areolata TaxID=304850 RepID=UPI003FD5D14C
MPVQGQTSKGAEPDPKDPATGEESGQLSTTDGKGGGDTDITVIIENEALPHLMASNRHTLGGSGDRHTLGASGGHTRARLSVSGTGPHGECESWEKTYVVVPENVIEAHRISNNYKFGLKKWKSHVTARPISTRSEIVQDLYSDINKVKPSRIVTFRPFNVLYTLLFGWWLSLIYIVTAGLMFLTVVGRDYGFFCLRMAKYFIWPFGKFVHQVHQVPLHAVARSYSGLRKGDEQMSNGNSNGSGESQSLLHEDNSTLSASYCQDEKEKQTVSSASRRSYWKKPETYLWLVLGIPLLWPVHAVIWFLSWFLVISIPVSKVNSKMLLRILFLSPEEVHVEHEGQMVLNPRKHHSEIIMYTHQAVNFYYYKLTVDGVNVILVNLLVFVVLSITLGFADEANDVTDPTTKCILGVLAIIPLTYYVGMAITSISAQSSFAVGAILNATFGSMVEVILFIIMLKKGSDSDMECYQELVKSSLTGAILVSMLFIPGISMVVGGIKFRTQNFNPKSANVSAALLFVSIAGMFSPTIFSMLYGHFACEQCDPQPSLAPIDPSGQPSNASTKAGFTCKFCTQSVFGPNGERSLYDNKVAPLVYSCAAILPIAYIVGLVFTMKTHSSEVYDEFETQQKEEYGVGAGHGSAHWSRIKSIVILLLCATAIALCGDLISNNVQPLLEKSGLSEYFIGVTMLSLVAELPEVVNGIQFALQNNVNLGIEIGSSTAIQVCLVQVPMLVFVDLIYPMGFHLIFAEVHFWAVIFSVIVINYIFQDGKSDYFQGSIVVFIYILMMMMYVFTIPPDNAQCINEIHRSNSTTPPPTTTTTAARDL